MRGLPTPRALLAALALLLLASCTQNAPGIPDLRLTEVSPARGSRLGGTAVTISGEGLFAAAQAGFAGELSVSVCGAPLEDLQVVDGADRRHVVPGGGVVSITEGAAVTGVTGAMTDASGDVVVTRPDGQTATLAGAFDCFDPAPVVARFELETGAAGARSLEPVTFHAAASDPDAQALTCLLDPGDGAEPYALGDCTAPTAQTHTYDAPGSYTAVLTVSNADASTTRELQFEVAELAAPTAVDDSYRAVAGYRLSVPADSGVLANDFLRTAVITAHDATSARGGTVAVAGDGSFTFDPDPTATPLPYTDTFQYTVANPAGSATATVSVVVELPAASASRSSVSVDRATLTADGLDSATATVVLRDENGQRLPTGIAGEVTLVLDPAEATLSPVVDQGDGSYSATIIAPVRVGAATLTASIGGQALSGSVDLEFVAGPAHALSPAAGDGATLAVASAHTVVALVADANGNPVEGVSVSWDTAFGSVQSPSTTTGADGLALNSWELGTAPGAQSLTATATAPGGAPLVGSPLTFTVTAVTGTADPASSTVEAGSENLTAGGAGTTITVTLFDGHGNRLDRGGDTVRLSLAGGGSLASTSPTDAGDGTYVTTYTPSTRAGTATVTATVNGEPVAGGATITVAAADAFSLSLMPDGGEPWVAGVGQPVTLTAHDAYGNVAESWSGVYDIVFRGADAAPDGTLPTAADRAGDHRSFGIPTELRFDAGVAATTITLYDAGTAEVGAEHADSAVTYAGTLDAAVQPAAASALLVAPDAVALAAIGATADLTASPQDAYGNPLPDDAVSWSSTDESVVSVTGSGGDATVTAVAGGTATVTASLGAELEATVTIEVDLAPGAVDDDHVLPADGTGIPAPGVLGNDALGHPEATVESFGLAAGDVPAGGTLAIAGGTLSIAADGAVAFTGTATPGRYDVAYRIANPNGTSDATLTLTAQQAPAAEDDAVTMLDDDAELRADLLSNDTLGFPEATLSSWGGGDLAGTHAPGASVAAFGGTVTVGADGSLVLTGPFDPGTYAFGYEVTSSAGASSATVTLDVQRRPTATSDAFTVKVGEELATDVLTGDDLGRPAATLTTFGGGSLGGTAGSFAAGAEVDLAGGRLAIAADGTLTLRGHTVDGVYSFDYVIANVAGSSTGSVTVEVKAPPVAVDDGPGATSVPGDAFHTALDTSLEVGTAAGLLANDTLNDPAAGIAGFGAIVLVDGVGAPAAPLGAVTANAPGSTVALGADGSLTVAADGSLAFTPPTGYTGPVTFGYRLTNDAGSADATVTLAVGVRPAAADDAYDVLGNVGIDVPAAAGLLANDQGDALTLVSYGAGTVPGTGAASDEGGALLAGSDGAFAFEPKAGFEGDDTLEYVVANGFGSVTGTATFAVEDVIWFLDADAPAGGDGTLARPLASLAELNAGLSGGTVAAGHTIFLHGSTTPYDGRVLQLEDGQRLIGQRAQDPLATLAGVTPPPHSRALPAMDPSGPPSRIHGAGTMIRLARDNQVHALTLSGSSGVKTIYGTSFGTLTVRDTVVTGDRAVLIELHSGTVDAEFLEVSGGEAFQHIRLSNVDGRLHAAAGTLQVSHESNIRLESSDVSLTFAGDIRNEDDLGGYSLNVSNGAPTVVLSGDVVDKGMGVRVSGLSGGSVTLSGARKELHTGNDSAIVFTSNTNAQLRIVGGGLDVRTANYRGLDATNGGSVAITGDGNRVASGTGTAIHIDGTAIAADGIRFESVSHAGGANGVYLRGTGSGSFAVTGTGTAGSGGTINGVTGADGASAGNALYIVDAASVSLAHMNVVGSANHGLYAQRVDGLSLAGMAFSGDHGTTASGTHTEGAVKLLDVGGAVSVTSSTIDGGFANGLRLLNQTPRDLTFTYRGNTVSRMQGSLEDVGGTALLVDVQAGTADVRVEGSTFTHWWGNAIDVLVRGTGSAVTRITDNVAANTSGALAGSGGIRVGGGAHRYEIARNTVTGSNGTAISADRTGDGALMSGSITYNLIGDATKPGSGSTFGTAIYAGHSGPNPTVVQIHGNVIRQTGRTASGTIWLRVGDDVPSGGPGHFDATVTGNDVRDYAGPTVSNNMGLLVTMGVASGDRDTGCFAIGGAGALANSFDDAGSLVRLRVNQRFDTTSRWPGYAGAQTGTTSTADMTAYLLARNSGTNLGAVNANSSAGGFIGGASCTLPSL